MQKILHVISGKGLGGTRTVFLAHQALFNALGVETTCVLRPGALLKNYIKDDAEIKEISYNRKLPIRFQKKAFHEMSELAKSVDTLWLHKPIDAYIWREAAPASKIVLVVHGFQHKHLECADVLVAVSQPVFDHLQKNGFKNIHLINNFLVMPMSTHDIKWSQKVIISSFGFFRRKKGFIDLLSAIKILKNLKLKRDYEFHIYGNGRYSLQLKLTKFIFRLDKLTIHKWADNVEEKMKDSDIVVIPSRSESFGMIAIEAMSQGALVISTRCKGPEHIITNNVDGLLTEVRNPKALAETIELVLNDPEKFLEIRNNGRKMVAERYTVEASKSSMSAVLKSI